MQQARTVAATGRHCLFRCGAERAACLLHRPRTGITNKGLLGFKQWIGKVLMKSNRDPTPFRGRRDLRHLCSVARSKNRLTALFLMASVPFQFAWPSRDTAAVAALLREYGQRSALRGGNPYRAKAYLRAADSLGALTEPLGPIIAQGALDYPDAVLERFDFVVASVHSRFKMDRKEQTQRIIRAVANPHTTILGHMTGRQL
jgi:hypothetical protein